MSSSKRNTLIFIVAALVVGYLFYQADSFWGVLISALSVIWGLVYLLPTMDGIWRLKVGFVTALFFGALVILIPTITGTHPRENDPSLQGGLVPDGTATWLTQNPITNYVRDHIATKGDFAIAPGLDLKGGLRLVYTVGVDDAIADKRDNAADEMRQLLATAFEFHSGEGRVTPEDLRKLVSKVRVSTPSAGEIRVHFLDEADKAKIDQRFVDRFQGEFTKTDTGESDVIFKVRSEVESQIRSSAVDQAKNTVHKRIDELGLREANLSQRDEDIIVEVPGQNQEAFKGIKEIIAKTARLEFKLVDDTADFFKDAPAARDQAMKDAAAKVEKARAALDANKDDAGLKGVLDEAQKEQKEIEAIVIDREGQIPDGQDKTGKKGCDDKGNCYRTNYAIRTKIDDTLDKDPTEKKTPSDLARERLKRFVTAYLQVPDDHQVGFEQIESPPDPETQKVTPAGWRAYYLWRHAAVTGDYITDARISQDQQTQRYEVNLELNARGGDIFAALTKGTSTAASPSSSTTWSTRLRSSSRRSRRSLPHHDGQGQSRRAAAECASARARAPGRRAPRAHLSLFGERDRRLPRGGRNLEGRERRSRRRRARPRLHGLYYRKAGIVADIAVLFNLLLQMAILASFGATMTLPGIAGLVLTMGIAVDANVLINERIREELRAGRARAAVEVGYDKAFSPSSTAT